VSFGAVLVSYVCYVLVMMNHPAVLLWNIVYGGGIFYIRRSGQGLSLEKI